jgi:ribosome maturation factor RimP
MTPQDHHLQTQIEERLAATEPEVEVIACERAGAERLRLLIDHPSGVDLDLCERVTGHLRDLLLDFGLEVSSPGPERPLTKPDHFRRFIGRRARLRTREPHAGQRSFTGELVEASDQEVTVAVGAQGQGGGDEDGLGLVSIPYSQINRSNLLEG